MTSCLAKFQEKVFPLGIPLPWTQLIAEKKRFITAVLGITGAVTMMLFQLALFDALYVSILRPLHTMNGDLVLLTSTFSDLTESGAFTRRRLYQTLSDDAVDSVASLYIGRAAWRNPQTKELRPILIFGCRPDENTFSLPCLADMPFVLKNPDQVFFDEDSRSEFGPIPHLITQSGVVQTECGGARINAVGLFRMGATFAADGNLLCGEAAFFRMMPALPRELINIGLIRLKLGTDHKEVAARLASLLPPDVIVLTKQEFYDKEREYWANRTPIGFVISASMIVGLLVGAIIMYQILYTDVSDHLHEYATLKAIGFGDRFFRTLILQQSVILSLVGFVPGIFLAFFLFKLTNAVAHLPTEISFSRTLTVLALTIVMCGIGGLLASRKLKSADPADLF